MIQPAQQGRAPATFVDLDDRLPGAALQAFRDSPALVRCLMGPIHGGRKTACVIDILLRAATFPRQSHWRWAAIRATLDELEAHTIPAWHARVSPAIGTFEAAKGGQPARHVLEFGVGAQVHRRLEVIFLGLDQPAHRRRLGNLEVTGAWLDAARDLPQQVLEEAIAAIGQYPSQLEGGALWQGVILSTRPPAADHWIPTLFEREPRGGYALFKQPPGRSERAENLQHLPKGFYHRAARGKSADWVRVHVDGECAPIQLPPEDVAFARDMLDRELDKLAAAAAALAVEETTRAAATPA